MSKNTENLSSESNDASAEVVDITSSGSKLTLKEKSRDIANNWLAKNRSLVLRQTPFWAQSLLLLLISLGAVSLVGSIIFRIDEVVTATGQLKSLGGTVEVKTPAGGKIQKVYFKEGDSVKAGDLLLKYDTRQVQEKKNTLMILIKNEKNSLKTRLSSLDSQKRTLSLRKKLYESILDTKNIVLGEMKILVSQGAYQKIQYLAKKDEVLQIQTQITEIDEQLNRIDIEKNANTLSSEKSLNQLNNELKNSELQLQYQNVLAPTDGILFDLRAVESSVLQPGEKIASIVPQNGFYAQVYIPNKDIGYIKIGQETSVRLDAFSFARYGEIDATVSNISADALPPTTTISYYHFPVTLDLKRNFLGTPENKIPLKSGMSVTANLKLRDKPAISLISDIFVEQADSVRGIRQQ
ncbi:HlyD family secretion protein [Synechococcus sp. MU1617]|uniref:HlyD family secretion protein n=1 Tax=Synechococcus sp. MU1617 TaxID=2508346 RepID=UPI001CF81F99|nr:HlyD family efflux transporter periplasmic adaptor subunit [Synechococcus sp. MU1617]MCB4389381.1 HlyD family efflux transporter periplasmic adaptor subunit [Synechococcus sp. MU1617]